MTGSGSTLGSVVADIAVQIGDRDINVYYFFRFDFGSILTAKGMA